ncbi:MAG: class I SAM-dependent methyltransferase [Acidiferrobacteraceae bacterium]
MNAFGTATDYWEQRFASRMWGRYPPEELIRFIARTFRGVPDKAAVRVLEMGCGSGPNIWYLVREGFSVAGIDGSLTAIRQTRERLIGEGLPYEVPRVDLKIGNFTSLPWDNASFDVVIDVEALYANSMANIKASIGEIWRTLKLGGWFFGKMFGDQTTGSHGGEVIEPGTVRHPTTGPCAGNEVSHFFAREEFGDLFAGFHDLCIDHTYRTDHGGKVQIFEWLVSARK